MVSPCSWSICPMLTLMIDAINWAHHYLLLTVWFMHFSLFQLQFSSAFGLCGLLKIRRFFFSWSIISTVVLISSLKYVVWMEGVLVLKPMYAYLSACASVLWFKLCIGTSLKEAVPLKLSLERIFASGMSIQWVEQ